MASDPRRFQRWSSCRLVNIISLSIASRLFFFFFFFFLDLSSTALSLPLAEQEAEENFDLALLATLEIDVIPSLGADVRIPDHLIMGLAKCLERASLITNDSQHVYRDSRFHARDGDRLEGTGHVNGTTHHPSLVPRERFSYWCLDLLFLICSDVAKGTIGAIDPLPHVKINSTPRS
jgi:hypothetical protein